MSLEAIVIAGANGAGKTTFARQFIPVAYPDAEFLNADEIQREGAPFAHRVSAGKEFLRRLSALERRRASFAVEITMSSRMYVTRLRRWSVLGYRTSLHFIELPSADEAVRRVTERVAAGGHSVPEADIRRRFERGLLLFRDVYKPLVDEWYHWFSDERGLRLVGDHEST
jgi:predicted ABC-type ATPase